MSTFKESSSSACNIKKLMTEIGSEQRSNHWLDFLKYKQALPGMFFDARSDPFEIVFPA